MDGTIRFPGSKAAAEKIIQATQGGAAKSARVKDIFTDDWDYVCEVPAYTSIRDIIRADSQFSKKVSIFPFNITMYENYWGLVFIKENRAHFYEIFSSEVYHDGSSAACVRRENAKFVFAKDTDGELEANLGEEK